MRKAMRTLGWILAAGWLGAAALGIAGCGDTRADADLAAAATEESETALPTLEPADLAGRKLRAVATTSIVADVVGQVGGERVEVSALMRPGTDPHSYTSTPEDLRRLNEADVIFVNGLGLEESILPVLENLDRPVPIVAVNAGVKTRAMSGEEHAGVDPHTWFDPGNVQVWAENIERVLSALDPAGAEEYTVRMDNYQAELGRLDADLRATLAEIPEAERKLVTDHDDLGYLADAYGFTIVGSVIPSLSTMAAASAQELAQLQDQTEAAGVKAIFVGTTVNPQVAQQLAQDLGIAVVPIYTDALSEAGGPAATYEDLMRTTVERIAQALQES